VVAEEVFAEDGGTVFATLKQVAAALRGTGDPQADRAAIEAAMSRLGSFAEGARGARASLGVWIQSAGEAGERLVRDSLTLEESAQRVEGADLAQSILELTGAEKALEATLQSVAHTGRRTLLDLIG
jgi:flagellin-like hook-associated protein FlgL